MESFLHFLRRDIGTSTDNDLLETPGEPKISLYILTNQITSVQPAIAQDRRSRLRVIPVSAEGRRTSNSHLSLRTLVPIKPDDFDLNSLTGLTYRSRPKVIRCIPGRWERLRHSNQFQ